MSMKKSDLDKQLGLKIGARAKAYAGVDRYGQSAAAATARREQRKQNAAAGLVPFACKLPAELVQRLMDAAAADEGGLNAAVAKALTAGLAAASLSVPAPATKE